MAACQREARSRQTARPQIGLADVELPGSARALQGTPLCAWTRLLLHLQPAGLPVRLDVDLWDRGANRNAVWHAASVVAGDLWTAPSDHARVLKRLQQRRCAQSGGRLWKTAEVDHRVPLFRVWREHRHTQWPSLLGFWGVPNLRVINRDVHLVKCAEEARSRQHRADGRSLIRDPRSRT